MRSCSECAHFRWARLTHHSLPFRFTYPSFYGNDVALLDEDNSEVLADLRALSQTCQHLRAFTLPLVWTRVEVKTVRQLGQLRELLRAAPFIASFIKRFCFTWTMGGDVNMSDCCDIFHETLNMDILVCAFVDRIKIWDLIMKVRSLRAL